MDPQAQALLQRMQADARPMPDDQAAWLQGYRAQVDGLAGAGAPVPGTTVLAAACAGPAGPVALRAYRPSAVGAGALPTVVFCHGGGFVAGSVQAYDTPLRRLAARSGWQVVAVEYRLAPEHPYPAAPEDCLAALRSVARGGLEADPDNLAVAGDSAGGLLATVLARHARDEGLRLRLQVMLYPNTDLRETGPGDGRYPSRAAFDGAVVRMDELYRSLRLYCGDTDRTRPDASPLLAPDLGGMCPGLLVTAEHDPLRDEGERYADRLRDAGVPIETERVPGMIHGVFQMAAVLDIGDRLVTRVAERLRLARR